MDRVAHALAELTGESDGHKGRPFYCADLFAKLKAILRKIAAYTLKGAAYSIKRLCKAIAACLDEISRAECTAYLAHSGYGQPKRKTL